MREDLSDAGGVLRLADGAVQVVVGPIADQLASEIRGALRHAPASPSAVPAAPTTSVPVIVNPMASAAPNRGNATDLLSALGGARNIASAESFASRVLVEVRDAAAVDESRLAAAGYRGVARAATRTWHVIVGPEAATVALSLKGAAG